MNRPRVLFVGRTRYRLPLSPSLAQKFDALAGELDVRVLASAAPGTTGDQTFRLVPPLRPRLLDGLVFWLALPVRTARLLREFRPQAVFCQTAYDARNGWIAKLHVGTVLFAFGGKSGRSAGTIWILTRRSCSPPASVVDTRAAMNTKVSTFEFHRAGA